MDTIQPKYSRKDICRVCGKEFDSTLSVHSRQFCPKCMEEHLREHQELVEEYAKIKLQIMHEIALRKLEKSYSAYDFREYDEAIEAVAEMEKIKPEAFLSSEEILTAIILYHEDWFFKINYKILQYKVDFYIPDEKIILEIDGGLHDLEKRRAKDGRRDIELREELGSEWEIIRVSSSYVCKYPKEFCDGILELARKQREIRKKHGGILPQNYSKSVKAYYEEVLKM